MRISFEVTADDVVAAMLLHHDYSKAARWTRWFSRIIGAVVGGVLLLAVVTREVKSIDCLVTTVVLAVVLTLGLPWLHRRSLARNARKQIEADPMEGIVLGTHTMEIVGSRFVTKTRFGENSLEVSRIRDIVEWEDHILIYVSSNVFHVIRINNVLPADDYRAFAAALRAELEHGDSHSSDAISERPLG